MSSLIQSSGLTGFNVPGGKLVASVAGGALTVALKQFDGTDPSTINPLYVTMQKTPGSSAVFEGRAITVPCSVTMTSGKGSPAAVNKPFRMWVVLFDDAGTFRLGFIYCSSPDAGQIYPLFDYSLQTTSVPDTITLIGGFYSDQVINSKPFVVVGYLDWATGVASYWDTLPSFIGMSGPNSPRPGDALQDFYIPFSSALSLTAQIPFDDTIPQSSEGVEIQATSFTVQAAPNLIDSEFTALFSYSANSNVSLAVFRDTGGGYAADAINSTYTNVSTIEVKQMTLFDRRQASVSGVIGFSWRAGGSGVGTLYVNCINTGLRRLGGSAAGVTRLVERMG